MTSMAATLAASAAAAARAAPAQAQQGQSGRNQGGQGGAGANVVPARYEESLDVEGEIEVDGVELSGLSLLKILQHSTSHHTSLGSVPQQTSSSRDDRHSTSYGPDALGVLLGLDLNGVMEVTDCFPLPTLTSGTSVDPDKNGSSSYSQNILRQLREVSTLDNPTGIYLSSSILPPILSSLSIETAAFGNSAINGAGFLTRQVMELMGMVEKLSGGRRKGVLVVHDVSKSIGGDVALKAYRFSDGFSAALKKQKFDTASLIENKLTPGNILTPLKLKTRPSPSLSALISALSTPIPTSSPSLPTLSRPPQSSLPPSFLSLQNTVPTSLPLTLSQTLSSLNTLSSEANNLAYQLRQVQREKLKHDQAVQKRQEENESRKKQGLAPLPDVAEPSSRKVADPSRLEVLVCLGAVDQAAKGLASEAGKGLVKVFSNA